jgi:chromosome segregation ATPase
MKTLWIALPVLLLGGTSLSLWSRLNTAQLQAVALEAKADELGDQQARQKAETATLKAELARTMAELGQTKEQATQELARKDSLAAQHQAVEQAQLEQQAGSAQNQTVALKTVAAALGDAHAQLAALQAKDDATSDQNSRLMAQVASMQAAFAQAQARDRLERESTATLRLELANTQQELAQARDREERDLTALRLEFANAQRELAISRQEHASLPPDQRPGIVDLQYLVLRKLHTGPTQVKSGTVIQFQPASWTIILQGLQSGTTYPGIAVTETVYNTLAQGQTYAKDNLRVALP